MKQQYVAPETVIVKVVSEAFICQSDVFTLDNVDRLDYGDPVVMEW